MLIHCQSGQHYCCCCCCCCCCFMVELPRQESWLVLPRYSLRHIPQRRRCFELAARLANRAFYAAI
jgi:hypothetical protein